MATTDSQEPQGQQGDKHTSRRVSPRIEVLGQLHGQVVAFQAPLLVRDIGAGGFAVDSEIPFPIGSKHQFKFTTTNRNIVFLSARVMHRREITLADGRAGFACGFAFDADDARTQEAVDTLLDAATSVIEFH